MASQGQFRPDADLVYTLNSGRIFIQFCGALASSAPQFAGRDTQFLSIEGVTRPVRGAIEPANIPDPFSARKFIPGARMLGAPGIASGTLHFTEAVTNLPFQWGDMSQPATLTVVRGPCDVLSDFNAASSWEIYSNVLFSEDQEFGARTPAWDADDMIDDTAPFTCVDIYQAGLIGVSASGSTETNNEVIDATYGTTWGCKECGINDPKGVRRIYAVTRGGVSSPGLLSEVIYTTDAGTNQTQVTIDNFGATEVPVAIGVVGQYLVVLGNNALFYATINLRTGTIGTFTRVASGFNASYIATDMIVLSPSEVFFCATGGGIYRSTNIPGGVTLVNAGDTTTASLRRIKGRGDTLLSVGDSGTIILSVNRGKTWGLSPTTPTGWGLYACEVIDKYQLWIGSGSGGGQVWFSEDGGYTWTAVTGLTGSNEVNDIVFPTAECGYIAYATSTPAARLAVTMNAGYSWVLHTDTTQNRVTGIPTHARINRIAVPYTHPTTNANNFVLASAATGSTDGLILIGKDNIV